MKRYKKKFNISSARKPLPLEFFEMVMRPEAYLDNIEERVNRLLSAIKNKKYSAKQLCEKLSNRLFFNKIKFIYDGAPITGIDKSIEFGINESMTHPNKWIQFYINKNIELIQNNSVSFDGFKNWLLVGIKHELVHRGQYLRIKDVDIRNNLNSKNEKSYKSYLSSPQEIMARAWEIVELYKVFYGYDSKKILNSLKHSGVERYFSQVLCMYHDFFAKDSKELKLLYKYMYEYLTG